MTGEAIGNFREEWPYHFLDNDQPVDDPNTFVDEDTLRMLINAGSGAPPGTLNDGWNDFSGLDSGPAGLLGYVIEFDEIGDNFKRLDAPPTIVSGNHWRSNDAFEYGWEAVAFDDNDWNFARAPYPNAIRSETDIIVGTNAAFMWHDPDSISDGTTGPVEAFFRYIFHLDVQPDNLPLFGKALVNADDDFKFFVNGQEVFLDDDGEVASTVDIAHAVDFSDYLINGKNVFAVHAVDGSWNNPHERDHERLLVDATISIGMLADYNNDGCVDRADLTILLSRIRTPYPQQPAWFDLNDDGLTNIADARKLVTLFTNPRGASCGK